MGKKLNVLISCPNFYDVTIFLPYIYGVLKLHCDENPILKESVNWERPIFWSAEPEVNLAPYELTKIDVLGISSYAWNWLLQLEIAKQVKKANPNCLVIAGGPHPHWANPNFFKEHPFIDLVVKYDGEIVFEQILLQKLSAAPDFSQIPGIIYPDQSGIAVHTKGELLRPKQWTDKSAFYDVPEMWDIANEISQKHWVGAAWETNRGCPYHCTFCDWGSATHSKIRRLPPIKIQRDMRFFSEAKVNHIFITDANFGIFEQDVYLAKGLADRKRVYGFPKSVYWAAAKNQADRVVEIAKVFDDAKFSLGYFVPIQSTSKVVLNEMGRLPKSVDVHKETVRQLSKLNVAMLPQIIVGAPGDTLSSFKNVLHELFDWGFHRDICAFLYEVLPNAPANDPAYRDKVGMITVKRRADRTRVDLNQRKDRFIGFAEYVVGHNTMPPDDWVEAQLYMYFLRFFHLLGVFQYGAFYVAKHLHSSYGDFYEKLFKEITAEESFFKDTIDFCRGEIRKFLSEQESVLAAPVPGKPHLTIEFEGYMFIELLKKMNEWKAFSSYFMNKYYANEDNVDQINEVLKLQELLLITPDYNPRVGRTENFNYNWLEFFKSIFNNNPIPLDRKENTIHINISRHGGRGIERDLQWGQDTGQIDYKTFYANVIPMTSIGHIIRPSFDINHVKVSRPSLLSHGSPTAGLNL